MAGGSGIDADAPFVDSPGPACRIGARDANLSPDRAVIYVAAWALACLVALGTCLHDWRAYALSQTAYWRFLGQPWKLATFALAATGITVIAPYTGDPTWDHVDALFMSVFAFTTAPWAVGAMYQVGTRRLPPSQGFVALCLALFSASWSYDLYLLLRDGRYPITWAANLFASSMLYLCAGLFWSLDRSAERGLVFAFMEGDWPSPRPAAALRRVLVPALLFMALVGGLILSFLWPRR